MQKRNICAALVKRASPSCAPRVLSGNNGCSVVRQLHLSGPLFEEETRRSGKSSFLLPRLSPLGSPACLLESEAPATSLPDERRQQPTTEKNRSDNASRSKNFRAKKPKPDQLNQSQPKQSIPVDATAVNTGRFASPQKVVRILDGKDLPNTQLKESQFTQVKGVDATAFRVKHSAIQQPIIRQTDHISNIRFNESIRVNATAFGTRRSASHELIINQTGQIDNRSTTKSYKAQPTRPALVDATSFGADPFTSSRTVINQLGRQFRDARKGGSIGTTGGARRGNFSRDDGKESTSRWNSDRSKQASSRPRRGKKDPDKNFIEHQVESSPEEMEYTRARQIAQRGSNVAFKPEQPTMESLSHMAPALAVSTQGMSEIVLERLRRIDLDRERVVQEVEVLARMKVAGLFPRFENNEQEGLTMKRVDQLLSMQPSHNGDTKVEKEGEEVLEADSKHDIPEMIKTALVQQLVSGTYNMRHPAIDDGRDILGHVGRLADRNGSYRPADEQSLLRKIRNLLPADRRPPAELEKRA